MNNLINLAHELKDSYFQEKRNFNKTTVKLRKIHHLTVMNWGYTIPVALALEVIFPGETESKHISAVYYSTEDNTPSDIYVTMLTSYASSSNDDYKLSLKISLPSSQHADSYYLESVHITSDMYSS